MAGIDTCRRENPAVPQVDEARAALEFLQKNLEHNYRFSGAMLEAIRRDLSGIDHEFCKD